MSEHVECVVVGAGVVGLAVARQLAMAEREVVVVEAADAFGTETSSRNSEVIHAGIYYPTDSLKARLCVEGKQRLYALCHSHGVPHKPIGKLIVATDLKQRDALTRLQEAGQRNGVDDLELIGAAEARDLEPQLRCELALISPSTGIVDSHALMLALLGDAEAHGAMVAFNSTLIAGRADGDGITLTINDDDGPFDITAKMVVNAAGLGAHDVAAAIVGVPTDKIPPRYIAKGNYFTLSGRAPFSHLIYPIPEDGGLGVHVTLDMAGEVRFGPDVEWIDEIDYEVDPGRADRFYPAIRTYYPALADGSLQVGYAGIRPKITGPGEPPGDFVVQAQDIHGIPGLINLYGIESPGITASLAIAALIAEKLGVVDTEHIT